MREARTGRGAGKLSGRAPEALIYRKGYSIRRLHGTTTCRSCFYSGRFDWPKPTVKTIEILLQTGMDAGLESAGEAYPMRAWIEIPAFKGRYLMEAIEFVLRQTSRHWELSVIWDGGDEVVRTIVEELDRMGEPRIHGYIGHRRGIVNARRFLTERSTAEWILPLNDDDLLALDAVECFLRVAAERPWAGVVRARRAFVDEQSQLVQMAKWFPF